MRKRQYNSHDPKSRLPSLKRCNALLHDGLGAFHFCTTIGAGLTKLGRRAGLALLSFLFASPCIAQMPPPDDANLLLLEVRLDQHVLSESLTTYRKGRDTLLPLGELAKLLTLAIRTRPAEGTASGFILQEDRTFHLDLTQGRVNLGNRTEAVDSALLEVHPDDIYVASQLASRWLPVDLEIDFSSLALKVQAREPLPLQLRLEREQRGAQRIRPYEDPGYPRRDTPYRLIDMPFIDQTVGLDFRRAVGSTQVDARYTAFLTGDFLGLGAASFLSADNQGNTDFRATLGRNDPDAGLLGPLRARSFEFGNITVPGIANITRTSPSGNGVQVSNRPLTQPSSFDTHSLQGDLPPGWDVELFFNDALIGFQKGGADGRYVFDDLPLVYGPNEFRLVFHGPQGQLRVERKSFFLEQTLTPPGEFYYQFAGHRDDNGDSRSIARFDWGLDRNFSLSGSMANLALSGEQQQYATLGLHALWQSLLLSGDAVHSQNGGTLVEVGVKGRMGGLTFGLSHAELEDFASDLFLPSADPVRMRDHMRIDGIISLQSMPRMPVMLEVKRDRLRSGTENIEASGRISGYVGGASLTNQLRWQTLNGAKTADGGLQLSRRAGDWGLRGQIGYTLIPENTLTALSLSADKNLAQGYLLNMGVARDFSTSDTRFSLGLNKSIGTYGLRIGGGYSTGGEITFGTQLFMSMGREPINSTWRFDALPMANAGTVSAHVFMDKNLNGIRDADEEAIRDVGFLVNGGRHPVRTDASGTAYLNRLPVKQNVDIGVDHLTLEDPQWSVQEKGTRLVPRPGTVAVLEFPVIMTSEIDGTVYLVDKNGERGIGDVLLELLDGKGNVVGGAKSASDGFYIISSVPPGNYQLRVSREQAGRLNLTDTGTRIITISQDGEFLNGIDFFLIPDWESAPEPVIQEPDKTEAPVAQHGAGKRYYTVKEGDWIWKIARMFYGNASAANANKILQLNRDIIHDNGGLRPGERLAIPDDAPFFQSGGNH